MENMRLMLVAALLSALAACACCSECPPSEDMPAGCMCWKISWYYKTVQVSCSGSKKNALDIQEIAAVLKEKLPGNTTEIAYLSFDGFSAQNALTSRIFEGLRVNVLKIDNCQFQRWADEVGGPAFVGLEDSLKELHILRSIFVSEKYSGETEWPAPFSLGHLRQVTKVKIFKNRLYVFGKDWFGEGGSSVDELDIEQNELHIIGEEALVGLTNMRNFKAERNHIKDLTRSMFPKDTSLVLLDVRNNDLEGFPEDFFVDFPSLVKIELNGNPIMFVPYSVFGKIWPQLNYIDFKDTLLHCDNHIKWMLQFKQPTNLLGWCQTPDDVEGEPLSDVLRWLKRSRGSGKRL